MEKIDISICLCTYNRLEMLRNTLDSLLKQQTDGTFSYEIVVVDDGSTDDTPAFVREVAACTQIPIRYFREERIGVAAARNRGVNESFGEWIAFIDDDEIAETCWLKELFFTAMNTGTDCVGGPVVAHFLSASPNEKMKTALRLLGYNKAMANPKSTMRWYDKYIYYYIPGTGNALVRTAIFEKIGFFDTSLSYGEDMDFFRRLRKAGFEISNNPKALVRHMIPASRLAPEYLRRLSKLGGKTMAYLDKREWGSSALFFLSFARISNLLLRRFRDSSLDL